MSTPSDVQPEREVRRLHLMLEDWYGGIRSDIDPITDALASSFTWLAPDGTLADRDEALTRWSATRNEFVETTPSPSVSVSSIDLRRTLFGIHQVTYHKEIRQGDAVTTRACSLWLRETERVPSGLQWLHLAEVPVSD